MVELPRRTAVEVALKSSSLAAGYGPSGPKVNEVPLGTRLRDGVARQQVRACVGSVDAPAMVGYRPERSGGDPQVGPR